MNNHVIHTEKSDKWKFLIIILLSLSIMFFVAKTVDTKNYLNDNKENTEIE